MSDRTPPAVSEAIGPAPKVSGRIPSLDGLRALAVGLVMLTHYFSNRPGTLARACTAATENGLLGVDLFFTLSGYLITRLLLEEEARRGFLDLGKFYVRCALRLLPPLYGYLLFLALARKLGWLELSFESYLPVLFFVYNFTNDGTWWLQHCWSLAVEEQFYLIWPGLVRRLGMPGRIRLALWILAAAPFVRLAVYFAFPSLRSPLVHFLPTRPDFLVCGCLLAFAERDNEIGRLLSAMLQARLHVWALAGLLGSVALGALFGGKFNLPIGYSVQAASWTLIIAGASRTVDGRGGRLLNARPLAHIGEISYDLYLWQEVFFTPLNTSLLGRFPWNVAGALFAAELSYRTLGVPFFRLRKRFAA